MTPTPSTPHIPAIAVTGGIGSGKSTVVKLFEGWGAAVVRADDLAREVTAKSSAGLRAVAAAFGPAVITGDGELDRKKLAGIVFSDATERKRLEAILHPLIRALWLERLAQLRASSQAPIIVYEIPLLFESGQPYPEIEEVVLVTAPEESRIQRIAQRDGSVREEIVARIRTQLTDAEKATHSSYHIANAGSQEELERAARDVFDTLVGSQGSR